MYTNNYVQYTLIVVYLTTMCGTYSEALMYLQCRTAHTQERLPCGSPARGPVLQSTEFLCLYLPT